MAKLIRFDKIEKMTWVLRSHWTVVLANFCPTRTYSRKMIIILH